VKSRDLASGLAADASGRALFDLGAPATGRIWTVRRVTICAATPGTAIAGTARLYVASNPPKVGNPSGTFQRDETATFPNFGSWGKWELPVNPPDHLFVILTGAAAGTAVTVTASVEDYTQAEVDTAEVE